MKTKSAQFWMKIVKIIQHILDCRIENLYVDVDFVQIVFVDCRHKSKNVVESTDPLNPTPEQCTRYKRSLVSNISICSHPIPIGSV